MLEVIFSYVAEVLTIEYVGKMAHGEIGDTLNLSNRPSHLNITE